MGTRLLTEQMVKKHHPQLRYVRIHTSGKNTATLYVWTDELSLPDEHIAALKRFIPAYLPPYVCFSVKAYPMLVADNVPQVSYELPDRIVRTAMNRSLDQQGIVSVMNSMIADGEMTFTRYDIGNGTLHFEVRTNAAVTGIERELIRRYLYEIVPVGFGYEVAYRTEK